MVLNSSPGAPLLCTCCMSPLFNTPDWDHQLVSSAHGSLTPTKLMNHCTNAFPSALMYPCFLLLFKTKLGMSQNHNPLKHFLLLKSSLQNSMDFSFKCVKLEPAYEGTHVIMTSLERNDTKTSSWPYFAPVEKRLQCKIMVMGCRLLV